MLFASAITCVLYNKFVESLIWYQ